MPHCKENYKQARKLVDFIEVKQGWYLISEEELKSMFVVVEDRVYKRLQGKIETFKNRIKRVLEIKDDTSTTIHKQIHQPKRTIRLQKC